MKKTITGILTDVSARTPAAADARLTSEAQAMTPWN